ncbi:MAG: hypothetical protein ACI8SR_000056 [Oceanicoccus sp.]|jgi:hypothetical protein
MNIAANNASTVHIENNQDSILSIATNSTLLSVSDLKAFFESKLEAILSAAGKIKKIEGEITQYTGGVLPSEELFKKTGIPEFRYLSLFEKLSYLIKVDSKNNEVSLSVSSDKIDIDSTFTIDCAALSLSVTYVDTVKVSSVTGSSDFTLEKKSHTGINIVLSSNVVMFSVSDFDPLTCIASVFENTVILPDPIKNFLKQHEAKENPLNLSLGYNLSTKTLDLTASTAQGIGPDLLSVKKLYIHKTKDSGTLAQITFSSAFNGENFINNQTISLDLSSSSCVISAKVDFPNIDLGSLLNSVNVFAEQVVVIEKKNWNFQLDLTKQTLEIESPIFKEWLSINICETLKFGASDLKLKSDKLLNLNMSTTGGIYIAGAEIIHGNLVINRSSEGFDGVFNASTNKEKATFAIPYSTNNSFDLNFSIESLNLSLSKDNLQNKIWDYDAKDISISLDKLPKPLDVINKKTVTGSINGSNKSTNLSVDKVGGIKTPCAFSVPLPEMYFVDIEKSFSVKKTSPGDLQIVINDLSWDLNKASGNQVAGKFSLSLPEKFNGLFGLNKGKPLFDVFKTYTGDYSKLSDTQKSQAAFTFDLVKKEDSILLTLLNSPFNKVDFKTSGDNKTLHDVDLGELGKYQCTMPAMGYDEDIGSWVVTGTLKIETLPSAIPLGVIKNLLERYDLSIFNKLIPDSIPLLIPGEKGQSPSDIINPLLEKVGMSKLVTAIKPFENTINKLLNDIVKYDLPSAINYEVAYSKGSYKLDLDIVPPTSGKLGSLKMMLPCVGPSIFGPQPGIATIELYGCSWGSLYGVPYLNLDTKVHFLDLSSMAISKTLHEDASHLGCELTLHNLFIINPFVDPVPLFIDKLDCHYRGIEQMTIESSFGLPKPGTSVFDIASLIQSLFVFLTTDRKLSAEMLPADAKLELIIGKNYIQLPSYLSGATFGKTSSSTINATNYIISLLNWLKSFALNDLVDAIPKAYRILSLPSLSIGGVDLVKAQGGLISLDEAPANVKNALPDLKKLKNAMLANVSAQLGIQSAPNLTGTVGMAINMKEGSGIYSVIDGYLSPSIMHIRLSGDALFKLESPFITSSGTCELDAFKHTILEANYHLSGGQFDIEGTLNSDFLAEIEDETAKLVQELISFDNIRNAVNDVANKTGIVKVKQTAVNTAKSAFNDAKKALDVANSGFNDAKSGLSSAQGALNSAQSKINSIKGKCSSLPSGFPTYLKQACEKTLEVLLAPANLALDAAKGALSAAKGTFSAAQLALKGAQSTLDLAKKALDEANAALNLAQAELNKAVDAAASLEKKVGSKLYDIVKDITKFSLNFASLDKTTLTGTLTNDSVGFSFKLVIKVLGKSISLPSVSLNIHDPIKGTAQSIAKKVLSEIV